MKTMFVRWLLTAYLLYKIFLETETIVFMAFALIFLSIEIISYMVREIWLQTIRNTKDISKCKTVLKLY